MVKTGLAQYQSSSLSQRKSSRQALVKRTPGRPGLNDNRESLRSVGQWLALAALVVALLSCFDRSAEAAPAKDASAQAITLVKKKQYKQALSCLDKAISKRPTPQTIRMRADCKRQMTRYIDAIDDYTLYSQLKPKDSTVYVDIARCYLKAGKKNAAVNFMGKAIVLQPKQAALYLERATLYDSLGQKDLASSDRNVAQMLNTASLHTKQ